MEQGRSHWMYSFCPDVDVVCPECKGSRYAKAAWQVCYEKEPGKRYSLPQMMAMDVNTALQAAGDWKVVLAAAEVLRDLGLAY